jgi:pimeloyl-ACP methyl ester carboxylesterase
MVKEVLEENPSLEVDPIGYERLDLASFLLPGPTRSFAVAKTERKLLAAINRLATPNNPISVIAHSYGTYAIARILAKHRQIDLRDLILCGAIIPDYDWGATKRQIKGKIINDYGTKDVWPAAARSITWGYGNPGTYGFKTPGIVDRPHAIGHSRFLEEEFVRQFWKPLFDEHRVVKPGRTDMAKFKHPAWFALFDFPLRYVWVILLATLIIYPIYLSVPRLSELKDQFVEWLLPPGGIVWADKRFSADWNDHDVASTIGSTPKLSLNGAALCDKDKLGRVVTCWKNRVGGYPRDVPTDIPSGKNPAEWCAYKDDSIKYTNPDPVGNAPHGRVYVCEDTGPRVP